MLEERGGWPRLSGVTRECSPPMILKLSTPLHSHHVRAQLGHDGLGVDDQCLVVIDRDDAHRIRRVLDSLEFGDEFAQPIFTWPSDRPTCSWICFPCS